MTLKETQEFQNFAVSQWRDALCRVLRWAQCATRQCRIEMKWTKYKTGVILAEVGIQKINKKREMFYNLNSTADYHSNEVTTLGWELTVCNTLDDALSPARKILKNKTSYGKQLFIFLAQHIKIFGIDAIIEVGCGYGLLMRDMLKMFSPNKLPCLTSPPISQWRIKRNSFRFQCELY